jgi:aspartate/methionine/tyrosine aminotransferase
LNQRLSQVKESVTIQISDMVCELERHGRDIIKLQTGDPDFATPPVLIEAASKAMRDGYTHYTTSRGLLDLRNVLSEKLYKDNNIQANPDTEILITHGAAHAIFITMQALLEPGDEVLLIEPYYISYASSIKIAGGVPITVKTDPALGFSIDIDKLSDSITNRSKVLILNSPCNPTGVVLNHNELERVSRLAIKHDLYVLCDDVYEKFIYNGLKHKSMATMPNMRERTITINSLSKTFAMTGWRIGYLTASAVIVIQILKVLQYSATCIAPFTQKAAIVALSSPEIDDYIEMMRKIYFQRSQVGLSEISKIDGIKAMSPQGAFYMMVDISKFNRNSTDFAFKLLKEDKVAVVPGAAFGKSSEGWIRLTFAVSENTFVEGIRRIGHFICK